MKIFLNIVINNREHTVKFIKISGIKGVKELKRIDPGLYYLICNP